MRSLLRKLAVAATIAAAAGLTAVPASVASTADAGRYFMLCMAHNCPTPSYVYGWITWYQRTVNLTGRVSSDSTPSTEYLQARFQAFAGTRQIGPTQTRTATAGNGWAIDYSFVMGDPDLVGGVNKIKITLCEPDDQPGHMLCDLGHEFVR